VPPFVVDPLVGEGGQPATRFNPNDEVVEVSPNVPSSILAKWKHDDGARVSGYKKSRPPFNLRAMKQAVRLMSDSGLPSAAGS